MNDDPVAALLNRAGAMLRELAEPGWDRIAGEVIDAVRGTPRGGTPLRATHSSDSGSQGVLAVTDLVLGGLLARAVRLDELCVPSLIDVAVEGAELKRIRIELTASYRRGLDEVAEQVRTAANAVVVDLLGDTTVDYAVDVVITDVVDGNPVVEER